MNTKSIEVETIVAGFSLFIAIVLFILLRMSNEELLETFRYFHSISTGAAAIFITLLFGFSYILGSLSHRIGKDISTLYYKIRGKKPPQTNFSNIADKRLLIEYNNKWLVKSFYRTLMLSNLFIVPELIMLDNKLLSGMHCTTILLIGIVLQVVFTISFFTQRNDSIKNS